MISSGTKPAFLITIDTEGDNLWSRPRQMTTGNARFLPRFQRLCEKHGLRPTYLVDYEMAMCPVFREFGQDVLDRTAGEIGMHLHAWNTPPIAPLTHDDYRCQPLLTEYPAGVMRDKILSLTEVLEQTFARKMLSHRAGRWAFDSRYARLLVEAGYRVDCSVTPHIDWNSVLADAAARGGADYSRFPEHAYFLDLDDIRRPGDSPLLEVPVTVRTSGTAPWSRAVHRLAEASRWRTSLRVARRFFPATQWMRPNGRNLQAMLRLLDQAAAQQVTHVEFMLHSSELMPEGSPRFRTPRQVDRLYHDLDRLFARAADTFGGRTLAEYAQYFSPADEAACAGS